MFYWRGGCIWSFLYKFSRRHTGSHQTAAVCLKALSSLVLRPIWSNYTLDGPQTVVYNINQVKSDSSAHCNPPPSYTCSINGTIHHENIKILLKSFKCSLTFYIIKCRCTVYGGKQKYAILEHSYILLDLTSVGKNRYFLIFWYYGILNL